MRRKRRRHRAAGWDSRGALHVFAALLTMLMGFSVLLSRPFYQLGVFFVIGWLSRVLLILHGGALVLVAFALLGRRAWARRAAIWLWGYTLLLTLTNAIALTWKGTWFNYYERVVGVEDYILYEGGQVLLHPYMWYSGVLLIIGAICIVIFWRGLRADA